MKTNSKNNRNFFSTIARVTVVLVVLTVAFTKSAASQNDGINEENFSTWNYSEFDMAGSYDLIASDKMALSPELSVSLSADGTYYIMSSSKDNSQSIGFLGQLNAPKLGASEIETEINLDEALDNSSPVRPYTALMITALHSIW